MKRFAVSSTALIATMIAGVPAFAGGAPTYTKDIAPILNQHCVTCHRPGEVAPMSLTDYEEVRPWVKSIARNVTDGSMPPWHADPQYGVFANDRSLSDAQIETIEAWARAGAPRGAKADQPPSPKFPTGEWKLGEPDMILQFDSVTIPADGPDVFEDLVVQPNLEEDRWLTAIEILPEDRTVAHHVIVFQSDGSGADPRGWLGAWAAGTDPMRFPDGTGRLIRKGTNLVADMHYHPSGVETSDATRIGLHFADDDEIEKELVNLWVMNVDFEIPPGAESHEVAASYVFPQDSRILAFAPHMHYRGKNFTYTATYPDGREEVLMRAVDYDFNWQTNYLLETPYEVPKGTRVDCVAVYDNSANNPHNPDPSIALTFGDESYDEMMIGFMDYVVVDGVSPEPVNAQLNRVLDGIAQHSPGDVYDTKLTAGNEVIRLGLHLPREGDGLMAMDMMGSLHTTPVYNIVWSGNEFMSEVNVPGEGAIRLTGTIEEPTGVLVARAIFGNGFKLPVNGERMN